MQCGAKCFVVQLEHDGELKHVEVKARTAVQARKTVRLHYEEAVKIVAVKAQK